MKQALEWGRERRLLLSLYLNRHSLIDISHPSSIPFYISTFCSIIWSNGSCVFKENIFYFAYNKINLLSVVPVNTIPAYSSSGFPLSLVFLYWVLELDWSLNVQHAFERDFSYRPPVMIVYEARKPCLTGGLGFVILSLKTSEIIQTVVGGVLTITKLQD